MPVPLILVSNKISPFEHYRWEVDNDVSPRVDYLELSKKIGGEMIGYENHHGAWYKTMRELESRIKIDFIEVIRTAKNFSDFNLYLSASEKSAIPLSFLMAVLKQNAPHILIGHHLSSIPKTRLYRYWNFREYIDHIICVSQAQADFAISELGYPETKVDFLFDKVDHKFFSPGKNNNGGNYILAIGQEQRDYKTLINALEGTDIELIIVGSSPWSNFNLEIAERPNVTLVSKIPYTELRELYWNARIVVIPLFENNYGAGLNAMLESLAMAKPLIITKTSGIHNYISHGETGLFVKPDNPQELKDQILSLWENPQKQNQLSTNARQAVLEQMNIDIYVERIVEIVESYI